MTYPSRQPEAVRLQVARHRKEEREILQRVNERLSAIGIDWKRLMRMIVEDRVEITVKENAE